jgi:carbon monoxide dehydrogenase subunit G
MRTFHIVKAVAAPPAIIWSVLADYPGMTKWAGARTVDIERPGTDVPNGVGTIRALKSWHGTIREEITGFEPERRMSYKGLSGVPARDYRGVVELSGRGETTQMSWTVSFQPRKITAAIVSAVIKRMVSKGVDRLVQVVERKASNRQPG